MDDNIIFEYASSGKDTFGKEEFKYKDNIKITSLPLEKSQIKEFINEGAQKLFDIYEKKSSFINDSSDTLEVGENVTLKKGAIEPPAELNLPAEKKKIIKKENPYMRFIKLFLP
jgi:hypothetical protein